MEKKIELLSEDRKFKRSWKLRTMVILGMLLISLLMVLGTSKSVSTSMQDNQRWTLDTIAVRTALNMGRRFDRQWEYLEFAEKNLLADRYKTSKSIFKKLELEKDALGFTGSNNLLFLIDDEGFYHSIYKGKIGLWHSANTVFASSSLRNEREISVNALTEMDKELEAYLCFVKKMKCELRASDGSCFTHILLAADKSVFDSDLSLSHFGTLTDNIVIDSQGRIINSQTTNTALASSYNMLNALQNAEFLMGDTYEEMKAAFAEKSKGSTKVRFQGVDYYMTYNYMDVEDWFSLLLVEAEDMTSDIRSLAYRLIFLLTSGFTLMIILVIVLLVHYSRESMKFEKETQYQLMKAAEVAEKANKAKSVFLSRMSHDIRTPINGVIGMTRIAETVIDDKEEVRRCLRKISSSSEHLAELVNEVLEISRIESGKTEVKPEKMNLLKLLGQMGDIIEGRLRDKSLAYETDYDGLTHPYIFGDSNLIKQILLNLLGNAVKYTPDGGHVKCTVYEESVLEENQARYHFIVEDTGIGMKQEFLAHIFERFSQENIDARTNYEGSGLGMAITKDFVDLMGGTIAVESEVGKGSKFEIILTFPPCEENTCEQEQEQEQELVFSVLLAEDNDMNRAIVEFILKEHGSSCVAVSNGQLLVERFAQSEAGEFDAIMTDIRMPIMDGLEAAKLIRAMDREDAKTIPIFAMTANAYQEDKEESLEAGMNVHLTKPLEPKKIMEALRRFCR